MQVNIRLIFFFTFIILFSECDFFDPSFEGKFDEWIIGKTYKARINIHFHDSDNDRWIGYYSKNEGIVWFDNDEKQILHKHKNAIQRPSIRYTTIKSFSKLPSEPIKAMALYEKSGELILTWDKSKIRFDNYGYDSEMRNSLDFEPQPGDKLLSVSVYFPLEEDKKVEIFKATW